MAQTYTRQSSLADGDTITAALFNNEYNQLVNAFAYSSSSASSTGHRHDGTAGQGGNIHTIGDLDFLNKIVVDDTNNRWGVFVEVSSAAVEQIRIQDGAIVPVTDSDIDLGTTGVRFKDAYIDSVTTTGNVAVGGNLTVTGTTTFNGGTITMGDAATDNVVFGADVDSNIIPDDDNTYDLGSSSQEWKDLYVDGIAYLDGINFNGTAITSTAAELNILDGVTSTAAELNLLDGVTATTAELNILDGVTSTAAELNLLDGVTSTTAELNILDGVTASAADINLIDGITNGTVIASKAIITDSNKDITGGRNITISGELDAATLDISGDADIDGTLEADAITIGGVTLAETISDTVGAMVSSNTETNISVTYEDSDNTLDFALPAALDITTSVSVGGGSTNGVVIEQGAVKIKNGGTQSYVDFYCESSNAHYARLQAPAHSAFSGNITATLPATTGTIALTSSDITGNAATATALATARTIGGVSFDGTGNINLPGVNAAGNQDTTGNAATATALATARTIHGVSFDGTANIDLSEVVQDTVGAMFSSNTETGIAATYEDGDGTIDLVIGNDVIVNSMIADDAIDSAQLADGSIDTVHIANDQVTGDKLANDITIANNLTVAGNLAVTGTTTQTGSVVSDSNFTGLLDENTGNSSDFGFYGKYVESSTTKYAGLFFDASTDNTFRLFTDTQTVPGTTVNTGATGYAAADLIAAGITGTTGTFSGDLNVDSGVLFADVSTNRIGVNETTPTVSLDLGTNTDAMLVPKGTTAQRPSAEAGLFRYNTTTAQFEGYTSEWGAIAGSGGSGGSSSSFVRDEFTGNGSTTAFTLSKSISANNEDRLIIFNEGVFQRQDSYTLSGTTLTFDTAPANGNKVVAYIMEVGVVGADPTVDTMTGDGSDTTLALSVTPSHENATFVTIDGVFQHKDTYAVSGSTLTFSEAPPTGTKVECTTFTTTTLTNVTIVQDADNDTKIQVEESSDEDKIRFDTGGTERVVIDSTGLDVTGIVEATGYLAVEGTSGNTGSAGDRWIGGDGTAGTWFYNVPTGSSHLFGINNSNQFVITGSGVGIGTTSPASGLHLSGGDNTAAKMTFTNTANTNTYSIHAQNNAQTLNFQEDGTTVMSLATGGKLGIGTTSPNNTLSIKGGAHQLDIETSATGVTLESIDRAATSEQSDLFFYARHGVTAFHNAGYTETMRIASDGKVGIGESDPTAYYADNLVVKAPSEGGLTIGASANSHMNYLMFAESATSGAGGYRGYIGYSHNATTASGRMAINSQGLMHFNTSGTERMRIDASGNVLVGTTSVVQGTGAGFKLTSDDRLYMVNALTSGEQISYYGNGGYKFYVAVSGSIYSTNTSISSISDGRLKENVRDIDTGLEQILALQPRRFDWKEGEGTGQKNAIGFVAQEVESVLPDVIDDFKHDIYDDAKSVKTSDIVPTLVKAIQEQQEQIEQLKTEIQTLKGE